MNREQQLADLKSLANELGVKVKTNWLDDWRENTVWAVCGFGLGYLVGYFKLLRFIGL